MTKNEITILGLAVTITLAASDPGITTNSALETG